MDLRRVIALLVLLLLVAGCGGSDDESSNDDGDARDAPAKTTDATEQAPAEADESTSTDAGGAGGAAEFQLTPELEQCMTDAGFTQDAPPTGGLAAWRHPSGGRVVVGSGPEVTLGIASEIGTAERPANVDGSVVIAANEADSEAARTCLVTRD